jgi:hypothetical protein
MGYPLRNWTGKRLHPKSARCRCPWHKGVQARRQQCCYRCHGPNAFSVPCGAAFAVASLAAPSGPEPLVAGRLIAPAPIDASICRLRDRRRAVKAASDDDSALLVDPRRDPREPPAAGVHAGPLLPNETPSARRDLGAVHRRAHEVLAAGRPKPFVSFPSCAAWPRRE